MDALLDAFRKPNFENVFGFTLEQYNRRWCEHRVERVLQTLAQNVSEAQRKAERIFGSINEFLSELDLLKWYLDVRVAIQEAYRSLEKFYWAYSLAKDANFTLKKSYVDYLRNGSI